MPDIEYKTAGGRLRDLHKKFGRRKIPKAEIGQGRQLEQQ